MKLTKEEAIKRHRELWGWLAENPMKEKRAWPGWGEYGDIDSSCFLCEYAFDSQISDSNEFCKCDYCPVEFEEIKDYPKGTIGYCLGGLFIRWDRAIEPKERSRIAALIRDLPEKMNQPAPKFKVGDKVVPVSKSVGYSTYKTVMRIMQENGCEYLIVTRINATFGNSNIVEAGNPFSSGYWYFIESDLIPYVKPKYHATENYSYCDTTIELYDRETIYNGPATICIINLEGKEHKGIAKCAPDDTFDEKFGQRLAKTRALIKAYKDLERRLIAKAREG